ncbi:hypothetical protein C8R44DRAFT_879936 [Mycena epipterygia]|nr:hypothetical protein C8R44DRAFT_879936 [Mycena epipterygia]
MNALDFLHLLKNQRIFNVCPIPAAMAKVTFKPSGGIPYSRANTKYSDRLNPSPPGLSQCKFKPICTRGTLLDPEARA